MDKNNEDKRKSDHLYSDLFGMESHGKASAKKMPLKIDKKEIQKTPQNFKKRWNTMDFDEN